jgi:hypothetical protein
MKQILSLFMFGIGGLFFLVFFTTLKPTVVTTASPLILPSPLTRARLARQRSAGCYGVAPNERGSRQTSLGTPWGTFTSYSLPAFLAHSELGQSRKWSQSLDHRVGAGEHLVETWLFWATRLAAVLYRASGFAFWRRDNVRVRKLLDLVSNAVVY